MKTYIANSKPASSANLKRVRVTYPSGSIDAVYLSAKGIQAAEKRECCMFCTERNKVFLKRYLTFFGSLLVRVD